jgi:phosphopantothenoylcysteine decarboxylase/phosphopantothenate--cysteine ligase
MGYAIAQAAKNAGATITLISGPVNLNPPEQITTIRVDSAKEMHQHSINLASKADVFIACAAVADYRVDNISAHKIKKSAENMQINLIKNPDIVADIAALADKPFTVGFAAETQDIEKYARTKLQLKNLDLIAANNVAIKNQGFNSDDNALSVYSATEVFELPLTNKRQLAIQLVNVINQQFKKTCHT